MSLVADVPLPPECRALLRDLVDAVPQNELLAYAATGDAFLGGGYRKNNVSVVRSRIRQVLDAREPIDAPLRHLLARHDTAAACLAVLSEDFIKGNREHLEAFFGPAAFLLALQLDARPGLLPHDGQPGEAFPPNDAEPDDSARNALRDALSPLLPVLGAESGGPSLPATASAASLRDLRAEVSRLKGAATRLEKEMANRAKAEAEAGKWQEKAEAAERERGQLRQRAEVAEAGLARCRRDAEKVADALVETRLAREFADWLGSRRAALVREAASADAGQTDPLLARAEAALARQAQADLAAGTRQALERRLAVLEETLRRCRALIADALAPSDELRAVSEDLSAEVRRLRLLIHPDQAAVAREPAQALAEAVNTAEDHALPDLQHTVNRLHDLGIVTDEARDRLGEQIRNRYATLYARRGGPGLDTGDAEGPEYLLRCALEGQTPLILLVDGHNTLYSLQSRYSRPQDHRGPSSEARDWLVNDLVQIFANARNCRVILVFDGPERSEANPAGNVKVVFSGGGGAEVEHRADDVLVDEARFLREADPDCRLLIATNDNGLSSRAAAFGARNLPPTALVAYFR